MTNIGEKLHRLGLAIGEMEDRHDCRLDDCGLLPSDHREIAALNEQEEQRRRRMALRYLWSGDQQPDHCKHRDYGVDEYLELYHLAQNRWAFSAVRLVRRVRVSIAILRGRWGINWRNDKQCPDGWQSWNAEDVCFFENQRDSYGYSVLVLRYHPLQDRVNIESDGESFM